MDEELDFDLVQASALVAGFDIDYQPGFKARLHRKDMRIVADTAAALYRILHGMRNP